MPFSGPVWSSNAIPHTNSKANVSSHGYVCDATVIEVRGARYRNSQSLNGVFEMVNPKRDPRIWKGLRVEVYCLWFGVRPTQNWPNIEISEGSYRIIEGYSGTVVRDIR